jgi:hypothetical protein
MWRVYISGKGRLFTEKTFYDSLLYRHPARTTEVSDSPDGKEVEWRVEGRSLAAYRDFGSGVRRMIVDFDKDYQTCSLKVSFGKPKALACRASTRLRSTTFESGVRRIKRQACPFATHPMQGDTLWVLRKLRREAPNAQFVFLSEGGACGPSPAKYRRCCNLDTTFARSPNMWRSCWTACAGRETISTEKPREREARMSTIRGSPHYAGLLPVEPSADPAPVRPPTLENDPLPNRQPPVRKRASRALARSLMTFCIGVAATLAWQSYGDAARQIIANLYPQLRWLAPHAEPAPETTALVAPAFDQQLNTMSLNFDAVRQSLDRIAAGQEQIARSIDQIATSVAAGQEPTTRTTDKTATSTAQAPPINASAIAVESQADRTSLQPTERLEAKPTGVRPSQTLSERGKQLPASGHDVSCFQ